MLGWCIFACVISSLVTAPRALAGITFTATNSPVSTLRAARTTPWAPEPSSPSSDSTKA